MLLSFQYDNLLAKNRTWTCDNCGAKHDRDIINASVNIRDEGLGIIMTSEGLKPIVQM